MSAEATIITAVIFLGVAEFALGFIAGNLRQITKRIPRYHQTKYERGAK